ncbi:MAG: hypothetical protein AAGC93_27720 [Cyanobacteria bacterium P01_F01_bin.53]
MTYTQQTERQFPMHTLDSAPEPSKEAMKWYQEQLPNLAPIMLSGLSVNYYQSLRNWGIEEVIAII